LKSKFGEKSGIFDHIFLNNFLMSSIFLGQIYLSESLGCKLTENYDGFENSSLFFSEGHKTVKKKFGIRHASKQTPFHTQFSADFYKISTKKSEKDHIS
jgi:hypothetical protein